MRRCGLRRGLSVRVSLIFPPCPSTGPPYTTPHHTTPHHTLACSSCLPSVYVRRRQFLECEGLFKLIDMAVQLTDQRDRTCAIKAIHALIGSGTPPSPLVSATAALRLTNELHTFSSTGWFVPYLTPPFIHSFIHSCSNHTSTLANLHTITNADGYPT